MAVSVLDGPSIIVGMTGDEGSPATDADLP